MNRLRLASIAAVAALAIVGAIGFSGAQVSVLNYFSQPTSSTNDNVLTIGGTQTVVANGSVTVASGATLNLASGASIQRAGITQNSTNGTIALDGSNPTPLALSSALNSIQNCTFSIIRAVGASPTPTVYLDYKVASTTVNIYAFTLSSTASPVNSPGTETVSYICFGI